MKKRTRKQVAKALAQTDGHNWDALDDYGKHSYLHYADVVISKGLPIPEETVKEEGKSDDNPSGAGPDNQPAGERDTSKPE